MNKKLQKIFQNYLIGRIKPMVLDRNLDSTSLTKRREITMMAHLTLEYLISIKKISNASQLGLAALFKGQVSDAKQIYETGSKIIQSSHFNSEAFLIVQDDFNASKGYYDYRQKNYESARDNLQIALEACMTLSDQYGYDFFLARSIHLACNIVKIEACSGNYENAIKIACYLIGNIEVDRDTSLSKDINLLEPIQHLSFKDESLQSFLFTQIFEEIAKLFASCDNHKSNKLVDLAANLLRKPNLTSNEQLCREYIWLKNKKTLAEGKTVEFLEKASNFLADGRGSCKLLWHATVLDVMKICENIDSEISINLQKQITKDFSKYKYLPSVLKA